MVDVATLPELNAEQLRQLAQELIAQMASKDSLIAQQANELNWRQGKIDKLTHELALHKRWRFGAKTESLTAEQVKLFEETASADIAAIEQELAQLAPPVKETEKRQPKRGPIPAHLPRTEIHHEPESTTCKCGCALKRIGEDVAEKLDYTPGVISVERHIRGKWVCGQCETLIQAPVPAQVIDKGLPTAGLLAQVMVAKYADHQPLYRQSGIFERSGLAIPPSTLGQWVGQTGVALDPLVDVQKDILLARKCSMPTRRRWRCSIPERARPNGRLCGATARPSMTPSRAWSMTSPRAAPASMPRTFSVTGRAFSSATTTRGTSNS
jgi:transposase